MKNKKKEVYTPTDLQAKIYTFLWFGIPIIFTLVSIIVLISLCVV